MSKVENSSWIISILEHSVVFKPDTLHLQCAVIIHFIVLLRPSNFFSFLQTNLYHFVLRLSMFLFGHLLFSLRRHIIIHKKTKEI